MHTFLVAFVVVDAGSVGRVGGLGVGGGLLGECQGGAGEEVCGKEEDDGGEWLLAAGEVHGRLFF